MRLAGKSALVTGGGSGIDAYAQYRSQPDKPDHRNELSPQMLAEAALFPLSRAGAAIKGPAPFVDATLCVAPPASKQ